jgi:hypothetical protein
MNDDALTTLRILPTDYPEWANRRIREQLGLGDADFVAMRRPYDDPRRTATKRGLLARAREYCMVRGQALFGE